MKFLQISNMLIASFIITFKWRDMLANKFSYTINKIFKSWTANSANIIFNMIFNCFKCIFNIGFS